VLVCFGSKTRSSPFNDRVHREIRALGYAPRGDIPCLPRTADEARALLIRSGARGAVTFDEATRTGAVWVWNPKTDRLIARETESGVSSEIPRSQIALRIAELLRAAFVECDTSRPEGDAPAAVSPIADAAALDTGPGAEDVRESAVRPNATTADPSAVPKEAAHPKTKTGKRDTAPSRGTPRSRREHRRTPPPTSPAERPRRGAAGIEAQGAVSALSFDHPPAAHLVVGGYWQPRRLVGPELVLFFPLFPLRIQREAGTVKIRKGLLLLGARLSFRFAGERLTLDIGAGVGLDVTVIQSDAAGDLGDRDTATFAALPYGRLGLEVVLTGRFALKGGLLLGSDIPRTRISILDKAVITTAPLLLTGFLGIGVMI